jgi:ABC-type taurine transport system substrate-binding protein
MTSGSASERDGAVYVAQDQGFFRKYGVDLSFVQVRNGPVAMSALSSGETQFHWGSVSGANLGAIAEGADLVFVAGFINRLSGMFVANPKVKNPTDLKGKSLGVNSLSGGGWISSMLMLDYWGLVPERDKIQFPRRPGSDGTRRIERDGGCGVPGLHIWKNARGKGFVPWRIARSCPSPTRVQAS